MQKDHRNAGRIAGLFDVNLVDAAGFEEEGVEGGDLRIERIHGLRQLFLIGILIQ